MENILIIAGSILIFILGGLSGYSISENRHNVSIVMPNEDFESSSSDYIMYENVFYASSANIIIAKYPNKDKREYTSRHHITDDEMDKIRMIHGIAHVYIYNGDRFSIDVYKRAAFSWDELEPQIIHITSEADADTARK